MEKNRFNVIVKKLCAIFLALICPWCLTACGNQMDGGISGNEQTGNQIEPLETGQQTAASAQTEAYASVLEGIYFDQELPFVGQLYFMGGDISENRFAIYDVDGDDEEELIIEYTTTATAGMLELIYKYDINVGEVQLEWQGYPVVTFYENGALMEGWSHNQGLAGDSLWPYFLYQYDAPSDSYMMVGAVDAWDKSLSDKHYDGTLFPDDIDVDGDGVLYYVMPEEVSYEVPLVDGAEYRQWRDSYIGNGKELEVPYLNLTEENIHSLC